MRKGLSPGLKKGKGKAAPFIGALNGFFLAANHFPEVPGRRCAKQQPQPAPAVLHKDAGASESLDLPRCQRNILALAVTDFLRRTKHTPDRSS